MAALALTDRDGVRGAVKFAKAGIVHGVAPILGADLGVLPDLVLPDGRGPSAAAADASRRGPQVTRTPARGGAEVDLRHPRVTVLARAGRLTRSGHPGGTPTGAGWAALNHLVSATHLGTAEAPGRARSTGEQPRARRRATPRPVSSSCCSVPTPRSDAPWPCVVPTWPGRPSTAGATVVDPARLRIEVVSHRGPGSGLGSSTLAARLLGFAHDHGRHRGAHQHRPLRRPVRAPRPPTSSTPPAGSWPSTCATSTGSTPRATSSRGRRWPRSRPRWPGSPGARATPRRRAPGGCSPRPGRLRPTASSTPPATSAWARSTCPSSSIVDSSGRPGPVVLRERCEAALAAAVRRRAARAGPRRSGSTTSSRVIGTLGYETYFLTVAEVTDLTRALGVRVAARGSGAGSLVLHLLGVSGVEPLRHGLLDGALPHPVAPGAARRRRRRRVRAPGRGLRRGARALRR